MKELIERSRQHGRMLTNAAEFTLPEGWTWERVKAERAKWGIGDNMVPVAQVAGAAVAWGTINSVRKEMAHGLRS